MGKKIKADHTPIKVPENNMEETTKEATTAPPGTTMPEHQDTNKHQDADEKNTLFNPEGELVVDVFETNSDFVVMSAIAGVHIKDLDISVEKDMMVIKGE